MSGLRARRRGIGVRNCGLLLLSLVLAGFAPPSTVAAATAPGDWVLVWADEFDGDRLDPDKWRHEVDCWGGGNNERQCYTDSPANAAVGGGLLTITALHESTRGAALPAAQRNAGPDADAQAVKPFSSARLNTRGKADWRYGRFEIRAKLPEGQGVWPAIWMLPTDAHYGPWASSGEIDIMEAVNLGTPSDIGTYGREDQILGTLHFGGSWPNNIQKGAQTALPDSIDGFHVFGIDWSAGRISWSIDGKVYATQTAADWSTAAGPQRPVPGAPFDKPFYLILNLAIGGGLPEGRNQRGVSESDFPKQLLVDWVRIYQCRSDPETGAACVL